MNDISQHPFPRRSAQLFTNPRDIARVTRALRAAGKPVALIPTMGALHDGHLSLITAAQRIPGVFTVVSLFVNPLQFAADEDLDAYPRRFDQDYEKLKKIGVDAVFAPSVDTMYPHGRRTCIQPGPAGLILEGKHRPTHFSGVLTVVNKLFHMCSCNHAFFGEKDYQQLVLIQQMVTDFHLDITVHGVPIVRDSDGLAQSSRNVYLSSSERQSAVSLSAALAAGAFVADQGGQAVVCAAKEIIEHTPGMSLDYVELRSCDLTDPPETGWARLLVAARVGKTRLIDNAAVMLGKPVGE